MNSNSYSEENGGANEIWKNRKAAIEKYKNKLQASIGSLKEDFFKKLYKFIAFNIVCTLLIIVAFIIISIYVPNQDVYFSAFQYTFVALLGIMNLLMFYAIKMT